MKRKTFRAQCVGRVTTTVTRLKEGCKLGVGHNHAMAQCIGVASIIPAFVELLQNIVASAISNNNQNLSYGSPTMSIDKASRQNTMQY